MKIIISRKGFDSSSGGIPSPIIQLERDAPWACCSLPIPKPLGQGGRATCGYDELHWNGIPLQGLIDGLRGDRVAVPDRHGAHLDPDLVKDLWPNRPDGDKWMPAFGQSGDPEVHLHGWGVHPTCGERWKDEDRPLFLFFGLFKAATGGWRYERGAPRRHVFWGWLRPSLKLSLRTEVCRGYVKGRFRCLAYHPHVRSAYYDDNGPNAIYVACNADLGLGRCPTTPGGGTFHAVADIHSLSDPQDRRPSRWLLPAWFKRDGHPRLSRLNNAFGNELEQRVPFNSGKMQWQELVLNTDDYPEALGWALGLIEAGLRVA